MKSQEATCDEMKPDSFETDQQPLHVGRAEDMKVSRVSFGRPPYEKAKAVLQAKGVRHRANECAARSNDPPDLADKHLRLA
jgi:hypothetical protein